MILNKPIPSSIILRRVPVFISYKGQPPTCLRCGCLGHFAADCTVGYCEAVNRINERDFPDLRKGKEVPTAAKGVNTHMESQDAAKANAETERNNVATEESEKAAHANAPLRENESSSHTSKIIDMDELITISQETGSDDIHAEISTAADAQTMAENIMVSPSDIEACEEDHIDASPDGFSFCVTTVEIHESVKMANENSSAIMDTGRGQSSKNSTAEEYVANIEEFARKIFLEKF